MKEETLNVLLLSIYNDDQQVINVYTSFA